MIHDLPGLIEDGEYGYRTGCGPRRWHSQAVALRETSIASHPPGEQHVFNEFAGTGAGKTDFAGMVAATDLNKDRARRVVVVVPSVAIASRVIEVFQEKFGIHLASFKEKFHGGVPGIYQGYVVTYQGVARSPDRHRRVVSLEKGRTLVIFDEVHHLGDKEVWGDAAQLAFRHVPYILTMSGSPFRPKGGFIPFARYVPTATPGVMRFAADHEYNLGRAILDGYCRKPKFTFSSDVVAELRSPFRPPRVVSFRDPLSDDDAQAALAECVRFGSSAREKFLRESLAEIRAAGRKAIIFLGGDTLTDGTPTEDAMSYLPDQLAGLGYKPEEIVSITQKGGNASAKIKEFQESDTAWILVTVNLVSEGVDIPELSAAIFLTTWTSDLSVIQRVGRALRFRGGGDHPEAWIYMFGHPAYKRLAVEIENELQAEAAKRKTRDRDAAEGVCGDAPPRRTEGRIISGGDLTDVTVDGVSCPRWVYLECHAELTAQGKSLVYLPDLCKSKMKETAGVNGSDRYCAV
jgi:superfamily II DNA or RNA helicase